MMTGGVRTRDVVTRQVTAPRRGPIHCDIMTFLIQARRTRPAGSAEPGQTTSSIAPELCHEAFGNGA